MVQEIEREWVLLCGSCLCLVRIHPQFLLIRWMEKHLSGPRHLSPGRSLFYQLCPNVSLATVSTFLLITVLEPPCSDYPGEQT